MPWRRVEQYIVEICRRNKIECERRLEMGRNEREALELLKEFTNYRREELSDGK